ncbi:MAG TPA: NADP-dependent oxidoreductase [Myxococcaceae bacterium]|nr:NADP-dependent oxidoreductase [Myxococcaceae bacterium]
MKNEQVLLARRPRGSVEEDDFRIVETEVPPLREGQLLTRVHYLSLDPYMRGRMEESKSYAAPQPLGEVMIGGTVAEVIESKNPEFKRGDFVVGMAGWQQFQVSGGAGLRKIDIRVIPPSAYLGCVGMPGVTAWYGLTQIGKPKQGETVVVSAAAGAVGSVVGQLAKLRGCRAVGIAGGKAKCDLVTGEFGFDGCIDYKAESFKADFRAATANGIDILFENVGGMTLDAALSRMNAFGRIALCGLIAGYNGQPIPIQNVRSLLVNRLLIQGFIVAEHLELWPQALAELAQHVAAKRIRYRETVAQGLPSAPRAFIGMLKGENVGKQLVKLV